MKEQPQMTSEYLEMLSRTLPSEIIEIKIAFRFHLNPARTVTVKKANNNRFWQKGWERTSSEAESTPRSSRGPESGSQRPSWTAYTHLQLQL